MARVLMPIGDATEVLDTMYPYFRLPEDDFEVVVAGPQARLYHMVLHEIPPDSQWDITRESPGYHLRAEVAFEDVDPTEYAGLFVSGGRAPEYLRYDQNLLRITRHFFEARKPVATLCHGIEILTAAGCIPHNWSSNRTSRRGASSSEVRACQSRRCPPSVEESR